MREIRLNLKKSAFQIIEEEGIKFIVNEIIILFEDGATIEDLLNVANFANGRATGFIPDLGMGKIEVSTQTMEELNGLMDLIKNLFYFLYMFTRKNQIGKVNIRDGLSESTLS